MIPRTAIVQIAKKIGRELNSGAEPSEDALAAGPILAEAGATAEIVGRLLAEAQRNRPNDEINNAVGDRKQYGVGKPRVAELITLGLVGDFSDCALAYRPAPRCPRSAASIPMAAATESVARLGMLPHRYLRVRECGRTSRHHQLSPWTRSCAVLARGTLLVSGRRFQGQHEFGRANRAAGGVTLFHPNRSRAARQGHHSLPPAEFVEAEERLVDAARGFENLARRFMRCQPDHGDAPFRESTAAIERCCA